MQICVGKLVTGADHSFVAHAFGMTDYKKRYTVEAVYSESG